MISVIIADDHAIIREGLRNLLENKGVDVTAIAKNGSDAIDVALEKEPDIVIMDISMPDLNGVDATAVICQQLPDTKVIALSMHSDKQFIDKMFASGASGYVLKESAFEELYDAIIEVYNGNFYLTPSIARMYVDFEIDPFQETLELPKFKKMSQKERRVLQLVAEGERTKDIAQKLNVSARTVETHRRNIMKKLGVFSIAGLTKFAIKEGLVVLE